MLIHFIKRKGEENGRRKIVLNGERNVTLTAYTQPVEGEFNHISKRPAVLILPGGGYSMCSDREAIR